MKNDRKSSDDEKNDSASSSPSSSVLKNKQRERGRQRGSAGSEDGGDDDNGDADVAPSITFSLFFSWVLPVLVFAAFSRYTVDTDLPTLDHVGSTASTTGNTRQQRRPPGVGRNKMKHATAEKKKRPVSSSSPSPPTVNKKLSELPTSYQEVIQTIRSRRKKSRGRLDIDGAIDGGTKKKKKSRSDDSSLQTRQKRAGAGGDHVDKERKLALEIIEKKREMFLNDPDSLDNALGLADALRLYELQYHQGGLFEKEAIDTYEVVVEMAEKSRRLLLEKGETTGPTGGAVMGVHTVNDEVTLDYKHKSADGLLCSVLSSQGKVYYMANMFEKAVESYTRCLDIAPDYLDCVNSRGSALIILGDYEQSTSDFVRVIDSDARLLFTDAFTGLARVLSAKEDAAPPGTWTKVADTLDKLIRQLEGKLAEEKAAGKDSSQQVLVSTLNRFHHVMFTYHDSKTKETELAWKHLDDSYRYKMLALPKWNQGFEALKVKQTTQVFRQGFWSQDAGSSTQVPIFIVGFVRSGSTLLERVLDAHPQIVGTGENSVFNGRLDEIRNKIVEVSMTGQSHMIGSVTRQLADDVVGEMRRRWQVIDANTAKHDKDEDADPQRFVDKMLTNYYNVGFIHLLYPKALILHVAREPMDTLFSAYKHEFPPGTLDYTSEVKPLAELYHAYRDLIEHWDAVLPGRVTHVRYEDMVHDMPTVAKAIIKATGLEWDESVLDFHRKKHAVNTLSTTQVRKGIYKDSLQSWRRYEKQLQPLVKLIGERVTYDLKSSLPGYTRPASVDDGGAGQEAEQQGLATDGSADTASTKDEL